MQLIRPVSLADSETLLEIYRPYVDESAISFELQPPSLAEFQKRISDKAGKYPWLVCEEDGAITGYTYAGEFRSRPAYAWTTETSVYVRQGLHGQGIGRALYTALLAILQEQGFVNVVGGITLPNPQSVGFHEKLGFRPVGRIQDAGFKLGRWWDIGFWELQFPKPLEPGPLRAPKFRGMRER